MNVNIKSIVLIWLINLTILSVDAQIRPKPNFNNGLAVGDIFVPPTELMVMRYEDANINWKDLQEKVIIFDFFDTYCTTCIQAMPKFQALQNKLKEKLQVFTVTWQNQSTIDKFISRNNYLKDNQVNLPIIYSDVILREMFPHYTVPHIVIIYKGKVQSITMSEFVTYDNVIKLYKEGAIDLPLKKDDGKGQLIVRSDNSQMDSIKAGTLITNYQNGIPSTSLTFEIDSLNGKYKSYFYNRPLLMALRNTWTKLKKFDYVPRAERVEWKVKDPLVYDNMNNQGEVWQVNNAISYERYDIIKRSDSLQAKIILEDLHNYFGIRSYFIIKEIDCLVLKNCTAIPLIKMDIKNVLSYPNTSVFATFTDLNGKFPPIVDSSKKNIKISIGEYEDLEGLNKQLRVYGIEAVLEKAEVEIMVIEELNYEES